MFWGHPPPTIRRPAEESGGEADSGISPIPVTPCAISIANNVPSISSAISEVSGSTSDEWLPTAPTNSPGERDLRESNPIASGYAGHGVEADRIAVVKQRVGTTAAVRRSVPMHLYRAEW